MSTVPGNVGSPAAAVRADLEPVVHSLREAAGDALSAVVLYGGVAKGRFTPGHSDINLLVLLARADFATLSRVAPVLTGARRERRVAALVLEPDDLRLMAITYPAKIEDIRAHHRVLHGSFPIESVRIDPGRLRHRILQELQNHELHLRQLAVERGAEPEALWAGMLKTLPKVAVSLESLLRARGEEPPARERARILAAGTRALGIGEETTAPYLRLHRTDARPDDARVQALFAGWLELLGAMVERLELEART